MDAEENPFKKKSYPNIILTYYRKALEIGKALFKDVETFKQTIADLEAQT